jgi:hypothetical protein
MQGFAYGVTELLETQTPRDWWIAKSPKRWRWLVHVGSDLPRTTGLKSPICRITCTTGTKSLG